jgi:hypothetical protein
MAIDRENTDQQTTHLNRAIRLENRVLPNILPSLTGTAVPTAG